MRYIDAAAWQALEPVVQFHVVAALLGLVLGALIFAAPKGTRPHRHVGRLFAACAVATAVSSFFIHQIRLWGPFSPIHILSVLTLLLVWLGIRSIRRGRVADHKRQMKYLYLSGFIVAGAFTLLPARSSYEIFLKGVFEQVFPSIAAANAAALSLPVVASLFALWCIRRELLAAIARPAPFLNRKRP